MFYLRWFLSKTLREAVNFKRHVHKLLRHQQDVLTPQAVESLQGAITECDQAIRSGIPASQLRGEMHKLERAANKWLKPYPNASWRENVEMLLVALAVAMAIRTFWLQPFKIPTGSMQPTLFGVTSEPDYSKPMWLGGNTNANFKVPTGLERVRAWFAGDSYLDLKAKNGGYYEGSKGPLRLLIFTIKETFYIGGQPHTVWFPPDGGGVSLAQRAGLEDRFGNKTSHYFSPGDQVARLEVTSGDHLFVNRVKFNFRKPNRGDIIVFETTGIEGLPQDEFYIKRLLGLGDETLQIGNDRHVIVNHTNRLDAGTPHFEFVYGFNPDEPPRDSHFSGHVNALVAESAGYNRVDARRSMSNFLDEQSEVHIPEGRLMVMGDNTMNSYDGRGWGTFDENKVIGNAAFVYWPISKRFGWGFR